MRADHAERLYVAHGPAIYARCLRLLGDRAAAEDATQEIFLKVHRHLRVPAGDLDSFRWIFRIATNLCLTTLRNRKLTIELTEALPGGGSLEELLVNRDLARRIIAHAPEKHRLPAWLHHVDGLGLEEVAQVLGVSSRTVATRLKAFEAGARRFIAREAR